MTLATYDGEHFETVAFSGVPTAFIEYSQRNPLTRERRSVIAQGMCNRKRLSRSRIS